MSAFQAYAGVYEYDGGVYGWRCYATAKVHEIRHSEHAPLPKAPRGRKWVSPARHGYEQDVACLIDESVEHFSQILLHVQAHTAPRKADLASVAA